MISPINVMPINVMPINVMTEGSAVKILQAVPEKKAVQRRGGNNDHEFDENSI
ncbi:MAG: hypothetical protein K9K78_08405 [Spirochaetales bacterium]|nr:hypothetical protein [Spirochaetales bacterium]